MRAAVHLQGGPGRRGHRPRLRRCGGILGGGVRRARRGTRGRARTDRGPADGVGRGPGRLADFPEQDGNFVIYVNNGKTWGAGTNGKGGFKAAFQGDGNLVYNSTGHAYRSPPALGLAHELLTFRSIWCPGKRLALGHLSVSLPTISGRSAILCASFLLGVPAAAAGRAVLELWGTASGGHHRAIVARAPSSPYQRP